MLWEFNEKKRFAIDGLHDAQERFKNNKFWSFYLTALCLDFWSVAYGLSFTLSPSRPS